MKVHSYCITSADIYDAANLARVDVIDLSRHRSRSRTVRWDFHLEGHSRRRPNGGSSGAGTGYAATWDQWGIFLNHLFLVDPLAHTWADESGEHFVWRTAGRFSQLTNPSEGCPDHRWDFAGLGPGYSIFACKRECGATMRQLKGHSFTEVMA
jgi:hypothetical protein